MVRTNIYIDENHKNFLETIDSRKLSEHIRIAINEYLDRLRAEKASASVSKITNDK